VMQGYEYQPQSEMMQPTSHVHKTTEDEETTNCMSNHATLTSDSTSNTASTVIIVKPPTPNTAQMGSNVPIVVVCQQADDDHIPPAPIYVASVFKDQSRLRSRDNRCTDKDNQALNMSIERLPIHRESLSQRKYTPVRRTSGDMEDEGAEGVDEEDDDDEGMFQVYVGRF